MFFVNATAQTEIYTSRYTLALHDAHRIDHRKARIGDALLQGGDVAVPDRRVISLGQRILPDQLLLRHLGAEIANLGPHVAVRELEPGARPGIGESGRIVAETLGDLAVFRVDQIGRAHV